MSNSSIKNSTHSFQCGFIKAEDFGAGKHGEILEHPEMGSVIPSC